jgi:hypothetical protein
VGSTPKNEKGGVTFGGGEAKSMEKVGEAKEPSPGCLFEAIKGFVQAANMVRMGGINKTLGLFAIDGLL